MANEDQLTTSEDTESKDIRSRPLEHQKPDHSNKGKNPSLTTKREMLLRKCINKRRRIITGELSFQPQPQPPQDTKQENNERYGPFVQPVASKQSRKHEPTKQSRQHEQREEDEDKELVNQFFEDNSERYLKKKHLSPVPVLPILVPDHLRDCLATNSYIYHPREPQRDRRASGNYISPTREERLQRYKDDSKENAPSMGPILDRSRIGRNNNEDDEVLNAALEHEQEVERRARDVRLRVNNAMDWTDPLLVAEYEDEIFAHLRATEMETLPNPSYTSDNPTNNEITWTTRDVLIDWVIEVHFLFQLLPETLFLAVNIIDRFLSKQRSSVDKLQLIGITALLIATKFEEVQAPQLKDFLHMTGDQSLTEDDLITAEVLMLKVLDYKICYSNPLNFLRRVSKTGRYDLHSRMLSKYLMEISCVDHRFIGIPPSKIAAASLWLAQRMLTSGTWTEEIARLAGYTAAEVKPAVLLMLDFLSKPVAHDAFFRKWSSRQLMMAGVFARSWVADRG